MQPFVRHTGIVAPLDRPNVDTDQIIPKQFLKRIERTGFGDFLFFDWRFLADGSENPDFVLNQQPYRQATILLARDNFGCGSSREHAPWALADYGFRALIAPSFADIFYNNCFKNGILPVQLSAAEVDELFRRTTAQPGYQLTVDLEQCELQSEDGVRIAFDVDAFRRECLLKGLDDISLTLSFEEQIASFEQRHGPPSWAT